MDTEMLWLRDGGSIGEEIALASAHFYEKYGLRPDRCTIPRDDPEARHFDRQSVGGVQVQVGSVPPQHLLVGAA